MEIRTSSLIGKSNEQMRNKFDELKKIVNDAEWRSQLIGLQKANTVFSIKNDLGHEFDSLENFEVDLKTAWLVCKKEGLKVEKVLVPDFIRRVYLNGATIDVLAFQPLHADIYSKRKIWLHSKGNIGKLIISGCDSIEPGTLSEDGAINIGCVRLENSENRFDATTLAYFWSKYINTRKIELGSNVIVAESILTVELNRQIYKKYIDKWEGIYGNIEPFEMSFSITGISREVYDGEDVMSIKLEKQGTNSTNPVRKKYNNELFNEIRSEYIKSIERQLKVQVVNI